MFAKGIVDHDIYVSFNNVSVIFRKLKLPYSNDRINSYLIIFVTIDNKTVCRQWKLCEQIKHSLNICTKIS